MKGESFFKTAEYIHSKFIIQSLFYPIALSFLHHFLFDPLNMPAAEAFDLASEFEIAFNFIVIEDAEAVDDGGGGADHFDDGFR